MCETMALVFMTSVNRTLTGSPVRARSARVEKDRQDRRLAHHRVRPEWPMQGNLAVKEPKQRSDGLCPTAADGLATAVQKTSEQQQHDQEEEEEQEQEQEQQGEQGHEQKGEEHDEEEEDEDQQREQEGEGEEKEEKRPIQGGVKVACPYREAEEAAATDRAISGDQLGSEEVGACQPPSEED